MNPKLLTSAPAWLKKSLAEKIMTETDPVKIREAQMALETIKRSEQMVGGGLTPEQAGALLQNLHRQVSDPALPPLPSMRQQPLDYAKGGSVPETRSVVRLPQKQREMNRAMNIIASQRHSPSMTSGTPTSRNNADMLTRGLIGAPMIGALTASPMSGAGRSAIAKLAKMLAEGSRNPGVVGAGAGIGAATELLEDDPTLAGALTNAALGAADVAAPIPTLAGQVLGYSPEAEAGGGSLIRKGLEKWGRRAARGAVDDAVESLPGQLSVVKPKGGNWLAGSVEDALRGLKRPSLADYQARYPNVPASEAMAQEFLPNISLNSWIEGPLTKYVKTRMASPEDEVRKLAEQGVLHYEPRDVNIRSQNLDLWADWNRRNVVGQSPLARQWEEVSDSQIQPKYVVDKYTPPELSQKLFGMPEGKTAPEGTTLHSLEVTRPSENLGFNHLIDELSNALNPDSGLPRNLQLTPEAVQNMSMEKAVRRVAEINDWRAAQKVEANRALAEQASIVREYTDPSMPNPKGLRWVELKGKPLPQDRVKTVQTPHGWSVQDKFLTPRFRGDPQLYGSEKEALEAHAARVDEQALADQLKYEGDVMGHCVGGYCDEVLSGNSRIFSLRDAKGVPHVTIEVAPEGRASNAWVPEGEEPSALPSIVQIKGKQNRAPNPEYQPFVQDFVRNSPFGKGWAEVGDLENTGLTLHPSGKYITGTEADTAENFAEGGSVNIPGNRPLTQSDLHAMIAALETQANA